MSKDRIMSKIYSFKTESARTPGPISSALTAVLKNSFYMYIGRGLSMMWFLDTWADFEISRMANNKFRNVKFWPSQP